MAFPSLGRVRMHQNRLGEVGNDITAGEPAWSGQK